MCGGNNIGNRFKDLRTECGYTQGQIAEFLGLDQSFISKCEKNERQFSADNLEKSCNLFGCQLSYFYGEEYIPLKVAFRSSSQLQNEDLAAISEINKIALNMRFMDKLLGEK